MSSAAAREARRKAILSRGTDRLSKLTSSARGEDNPVYANIDTPMQKASTTETFVGEESIMPTPPARASPVPVLNNPATDSGPSAWSTEQQQEFMRALMAAPELTGATLDSRGPGARPTAGQVYPDEGFGGGAGDDPMAAMLNALSQFSGQAPPGLGSMPGMPPMTMGQSAQAIPIATPPTLFSKLRPLLHLLASWILLAFSALVTEPKAYAAYSHSRSSGSWERWAELGWRSAKEPFGVHPVPFFWAFSTLQLVLHSAQIFMKSNSIQPPTLLALALPHLPPIVHSIVMNTLTYIQMGGMLLDDLAGLVVGVGVLVWLAGWVADGQ
ncbi:hypothetical protein EW145_g5262 [Phellinidium pouzarii]|uniref:Golgi to ER traffic protein 2 n=1 Tax=Phellinidium pouzarii TaxID=167371 RepID=A0A4S4L1Z5_9AGAM|nr:hypothetical protein EW145_g5262 [Phellinidium pouzarii]